MSGVGAGICEGAIVCSPELVKIRMQLPENRGLYSSSIQAASAIIRHEGVAALFTGFWCTLLRNACWNGTYFGSIFAIKSTIYSTKEESKFLNFAAGTIAGSLGCCVNTPLDVVKTRMQNSSALKQARPEDAGRLLAVSSLWKGLAPKIIRLGPGGGIMLVVYEQVTDYLGRLERRAGTH
ncbi:oxoglutarate/malate translocator protein, putative [Perkinsus marinus ATCC 50983]|uniref:Oxoglutarate/malate translocator protein, putative n=1 Tax=Perkinsus marinus (strain ATCC 50983 / TXsc) TaxID=423536 RepID=C5KF28_PERM5|nr:oxoglutarate/malate translocator protein, putative [Perkinsus marinus ATCC 50983]EER16915.1 oxoglutarate/malate translocator protein, putative [Perkinsus marinus ATCC 50983]|eukprot:XP_002785119.1 oxoglutarate/malate translocator protein, putative [Perkinsus marinus ATCC 50983]